MSEYSWMGNEAWTEALKWHGSKGFQSASKKSFKVKSTGTLGGVYKGAEGLTFMKVRTFVVGLTV
jgi:carboxypeptidase C (cathepsin A)